MTRYGFSWGGSSLLSSAFKVHEFLYRAVMCRIAELPENSDLFVSIKHHKLRGEEAG
jgi:hypothetical protein